MPASAAEESGTINLLDLFVQAEKTTQSPLLDLQCSSSTLQIKYVWLVCSLSMRKWQRNPLGYLRDSHLQHVMHHINHQPNQLFNSGYQSNMIAQ